MQAMHDTSTLSVIASYLSSFNASNPKKNAVHLHCKRNAQRFFLLLYR